MTSIGDIMRTSPVIPVLVIDKVEDAGPLAQALCAGGLKVLEVTLRTPAALEAIAAMCAAAPDAIVGAGTVLNGADLDKAVAAGAKFIVSPGFTEPLGRAAEAAKVPLLPGVATAADIMRGLDAGLTHFKFFPAETSGGIPALKAFAGPFGQIRFCPTGGIGEDNAADYLKLPQVLCVGGSWPAPKSAVSMKDWSRITDLARGAAQLGR
ncbi:MAG: bifunctional 4-hydroxy-2-oxoglutarate aldolase/2-dehydro-3-deoxy-phosphogluconate aldolase [Caulobacteraceae bacterium]